MTTTASIYKTKTGQRYLKVNNMRVGINIATGPWIGIDQNTIKIRRNDKQYFPKEIAQILTVENGSDMQIDYFESDVIRLLPGHALYEQAKEVAK